MCSWILAIDHLGFRVPAWGKLPINALDRAFDRFWGACQTISVVHIAWSVRYGLPLKPFVIGRQGFQRVLSTLQHSQPLLCSSPTELIRARGVSSLLSSHALHFHPSCFFRAAPTKLIGAQAVYILLSTHPFQFHLSLLFCTAPTKLIGAQAVCSLLATHPFQFHPSLFCSSLAQCLWCQSDDPRLGLVRRQCVCCTLLPRDRVDSSRRFVHGRGPARKRIIPSP
mmetsp:Transcript_3405/g.8114  ORF Transcript_3405/g.8114 Transcript_3405/m.8114 type:complete len:225 (+) Transcript_3405:2396-3070(+)